MFPNPKKALCALWVSMLICFKGFSHTPGFSQMGSNIEKSFYRCSWHINPGSTDKVTGGSVTIHFVTVRYDGGAIAVAMPAAPIIEAFPVSLPNNISGAFIIHEVFAVADNMPELFLHRSTFAAAGNISCIDKSYYKEFFSGYTATIPSGTYVMQLECAEQYCCCTTDFIPALNSYEERLPLKV